MSPELSAIVVNYRTAAEAAACVASLRESFAREGIAGEIVLVDCASGNGELARLQGAGADDLVALPENRGYSGGLNAGLARARAGTLVLSNADVIFLPGALTALRAAVADRGVGAAAPLAVWDAEGRIRLPAGFASSFFRDLGQLLAGRWPRLDRARFTAFALRTTALWEHGGDAEHVIGAVLAVRRDVFDLVGRFDERFPFEYEETEWEERVRAAGLSLRFVAGARVRHFWARSSAADPAQTAALRAVSRRLYQDGRYGRGGRMLLERAARQPRRLTVRVEQGPVPPSFPPSPGASLAVSPNPSRLPFAGTDLETGFVFSTEICDRLVGRWYFTVFRREDGCPLQTIAWEKG